MTDNFRLHKLLFFLGDIPVVLGPFCPLLFSRREAEIILAENSIEEIPAMEYLSYTASYPPLPEKSAIGIVRAILHSLYPSEDDRPVESIARELAVSKNHLINRFRTEVGETPMQYLTNLRLKQAALLLAEHDLSVQDIAAAVGIPDANYFTKLFKRAYGKTPLKYRKDHSL